jgi:hypothetical protein
MLQKIIQLAMLAIEQIIHKLQPRLKFFKSRLNHTSFASDEMSCHKEYPQMSNMQALSLTDIHVYTNEQSKNYTLYVPEYPITQKH